MLHPNLNVACEIWDKDIVGKDFLGMVNIPIADITTQEYDYSEEVWYPLNPRSHKDKVSGEILLKIGYLGELDEKIKTIIDTFAAKMQLHARIVSSDDPNDDFFNSIAGVGVDKIGGLGPSMESLSQSAKDLTDTIKMSRLNHSQLVGMMTLEIGSAKNLPYQKNVLNSGFDCDPFVVISYGKKTFKTRVIRHSLNPVWNEAAFLHVKALELENDFTVVFSVYDYDTITHNDHIGTVEVSIKELINCTSKQATVPNSATHFPLSDFDLKLKPRNGVPLNPEPQLFLRVGFVPYRDIRRNFWLTLCKNYDIDNNGTISQVELLALLDSLGSTYSNQTVDLLMSHGNWIKETEEYEISFEKLFEAVESQLISDDGILREEHLISISECPICRKKIRQGTGDLDLISHVALCAHEDLSKLDRLFVQATALKTELLNRRYSIVGSLGEGAGGEVYKALDTQTQEIVAIKNEPLTTPEDSAILWNEYDLIGKLSSSPYIVNALDGYYTQDSFNLVLEYMPGGNLWDYFLTINPDTLKWMLIEITLGVKDMHEKDICHGDLKLENILLSEEVDDNHVPETGPLVKIADLGFAHSASITDIPVRGSKEYMAPELYRAHVEKTQVTDCKAVDIWALGVIYFVSQTEEFPFGDPYEQFFWGTPVDELFKNDISKYHYDLKDITSKMLSMEPNDRPSIQDVLEALEKQAQDLE